MFHCLEHKFSQYWLKCYAIEDICIQCPAKGLNFAKFVHLTSIEMF